MAVSGPGSDSGGLDPAADPTPRWCVVANVVAERLHGSEGEVRRGTKHFSGGTKVHLVSGYWGMGGETVTVLGLARRPKRWITVDVRARVLENWRAKLVYDPAVLRRLPDAGPSDEEEARRVAARMTAVSATDRVRLIESDQSDVQRVAEALEADGRGVLRGRFPMPTAQGRPIGFVLHDGPEAEAGAVVFEFDDGKRSWSSIWVANDYDDALAALIVAVQGRHVTTNHWSMPELITQIRLAREALNVQADSSAESPVSNPDVRRGHHP